VSADEKGETEAERKWVNVYAQMGLKWILKEYN